MKERRCNMRKWIALLIMISLLSEPAYSQSGNCYNHGEKTVYSVQRAIFTVCSIYTLRIEMCTMRSNRVVFRSCYQDYESRY